MQQCHGQASHFDGAGIFKIVTLNLRQLWPIQTILADVEYSTIRYHVCSSLSFTTVYEIFPVAHYICNRFISITTIPHFAEHLFYFFRLLLLSEPAFEGSTILVVGGDCTLLDEIFPIYEGLMDYLAVSFVCIVLGVPVEPLEFIGCGITVWIS